MTTADISSILSNIIFLLFLVGIPVYGYFKGVKVYEVFVDGAKEGFEITIRIIPYLVAILVAVGMFRASGAMDLISRHLPQFFAGFGLSPEIMSLILVRPLSGSAALGILGEIIGVHGADSYDAKLASVILGSTETTFYIIAVYFGAVSISKVRYALHAGLIADFAGVLAALLICRILFG
jgi:spore maturation protein B